MTHSRQQFGLDKRCRRPALSAIARRPPEANNEADPPNRTVAVRGTATNKKTVNQGPCFLL